MKEKRYCKLQCYMNDYHAKKQTKKLSFSKFKFFLIFLCILGLIVSYGCQRKKGIRSPYDSTNNGRTNKQPIPEGTFSISEKTDNNTTNFIVKTSTNVGQIKIGFVSENDYSYTLTYRVEDEDKTTSQEDRIITEDTTYANDILTINESGLKKIRNLDSSSGPKSKDISILFTFTADNTNLNNFKIADRHVAVTLTHAQTFTTDDAKSNFIEKALKKGSGIEEIESDTDGKVSKAYSYSFTNGTFDLANKTFTITNAIGDGTNEKPITKSEIKTLADSTLKVSGSVSDVDISEITKSEFSKEEPEGGGDTNSYSLTYNITWADIYDLDITEITIKFESKEEKGFTDNSPETPTPPETTRNSRFGFSFVIKEKYFIKPEDNIKYI